MSETTATAEKLLNNLITQAQGAQPRAFELNRPFFEIGMPVAWPPMGDIDVTHRLRRADPNEEAEYKRMMISEERILATGKIIDERTAISPARSWLWDQTAVAVRGYPPLEAQADSEGWVALTPELKRQMRVTDKERAIRGLFDCEVKIVMEESMRTFTGGEWAVLLQLGPKNSFYAAIKLRFAEWGEKQKDKFEGSASAGSSEIQGKTRLSTSAVNQKAFTTLFAGTLIDVKADRASGLHDVITVDGEPFSQANKDKFAAAFLGEWQTDVISALVVVWRGK